MGSFCAGVKHCISGLFMEALISYYFSIPTALAKRINMMGFFVFISEADKMTRVVHFLDNGCMKLIDSCFRFGHLLQSFIKTVTELQYFYSLGKNALRRWSPCCSDMPPAHTQVQCIKHWLSAPPHTHKLDRL